MTTSMRLCLLVATLAFAATAFAQAPADGTDPSATASQQQGRELLMSMARFLGGLDRFAVTVRAGYDVLQENGTKIQFLESRAVTLARPDRFRTEETHADGRNSSILFDGKTVTVYDAEYGVYAQADQPGSIDDALIYFTRELKMRLPLAALFTSRFQEELAPRLQFADYVETAYVFEVPTHHVIGRTAVVDFQVWIADGKEPWPRRLVLTYRNEPGQPQFWAEFEDWNARPRITKKTFEFRPPADASAILFAVQLSPLAPPPIDAAAPPAGVSP
jgi:hypothetical protein